MNTSCLTPVLRSTLLKSSLAPLLLAALIPQQATAASGYYQPAVNAVACSDVFTDGDCWSTGAAPGAGESAYFNNGLSYNLSFTAPASFGTAKVYNDTVTWLLNGNTVTLTDYLYAGTGNIGNVGNLTLSGGTVSNSVGWIGSSSNTTGTITVGNAAWNNSSNVIVGSYGTGTLNINNGGAVTSNYGLLATYGGSSGTATVNNGGSWNTVSGLYVGGNNANPGGTGGLTVHTGGSVDVGTELKAWGGGTINLFGGTIITADFNSSLGTFNHTGGILTVDGGSYSDGAADMVVNGTNFPRLELINGAEANYASGDAVVGDDETGVLHITTSSSATNVNGRVGWQKDSSGTVRVRDASSKWTNTSSLTIGSSGTGVLEIDNGGQVESGGAVYLGRYDNAGTEDDGDGTVTVSGSDSKLYTTGSGSINIGYAGDGALTVEAGGVVESAGNTYIGRGGSGAGTATVTGANSTLSSASTLFVGYSGSGILDIESGGAASSTNGGIVIGGSGTGTVTVDGGSSVLSAYSDLYVGSSGTGILNLQIGGKATNVHSSSDVYVGRASGGSGTVNINAGGVLSSVDDLFVGGDSLAAGGTGVINVINGGTLTVADTLKVWADNGGDTQLNISGGTTTVGSFDAAAGNFNFTGGHLIVDGGTYGDGLPNLIIDGINGPTLTLRNGATGDGVATNPNAYVGNNGQGTLNIESGSSFSGEYGIVANGADSSGTVTVSGAGSAWINSSDLSIGSSGSGTLTVADQGLVTSGADITLGYSEAGSGTVTVTGSGSTLANGGWDFNVGRYGEGTLNVLAGGEVSSAYYSDLGKYSTAVGTATVSGPGSTWSTSRELVVGAQGTGTLSVRDGGRVSTSLRDIVVGELAGSVGMVTVEGAGTTLHSGDDLVVGRYGTGTLIQEGGNVSATGFSDDTYIGEYAGGSGTVTLNGGVMETNEVYLGGSYNSAGGTGVLNVNLGGNLIASSTMKLYSGGTVNLNGGAIMANALYSDGSFNFNAGYLTIGNGLATSNLGSNFALNRMSTLTVGGTTTLDGFSMFTLDGGTFSTGGLVDNGGFTFNSGTLNITNDNLSIGSAGQLGGDVELVRGQTLTTTMAAVVAGDGLLYLNGGNYSGSLTNAGQVTIDSQLSNLGGTITNDGLLNGNGRVSALLINNTSGEVLAESGDTLRFTGSGNSNSGQITLAGGTARFEEDLTNEFGGAITGRGTLYANGGLTNRGNMGFSAGTTDIHGDVNNEAGASIIVSGGGTLTFFDDLVHNGTEIRVSGGSRAVFFGTVSGAGNYTGTGTAQFEGDLMIGNSPTLTTSTLDMILAGNTTVMELGGVVRGTEYDAFDIDATLEILQGSTLEVVYWESFAANVGDVFDLFIAETILGDFGTLDFSGLGGGLTWQLDHLVDEFGTGDVLRLTAMSAVPLPPAAWLFGSALLGLIGLRRRRSVH